MKVVAITGGTGFIGKYLTKSLIDNNFEVRILSRNKNLALKKGFYYWNPFLGEIDEKVLHNVDIVINLAGANISSKRWTEKRKIEIIESRTIPLNFLYEKFKSIEKKPNSLISVSAVGYYGTKQSEKVFVESDPPGDDFLGQVCVKWEKSADKFNTLGSRVVKLRIGAVLGLDGGVIKKLYPIFNYGLGAVLGTGKQTFSFIQINDLINIFNFVLDNENIDGPYNTVSPDIVTNNDFSQLLAKAMNKKIILPNIPSSILKLVLGELSDMLLNGNAISSQKLINEGFQFEYSKLDNALGKTIKN